MTTKQNNPVAVVTGGTGGIGLEACKQVAAKGLDVILTSRSDAKGKAAVQEIETSLQNNKSSSSSDVNVSYVVMELSSLSSVAAGCQELLKRGTKIDYLLLNAGVVNRFMETTEDGLEQTVAVNHVAGTLIAKMILPHMEQTATVSKPMITFVSSDLHNIHSPTGASNKVGPPITDEYIRYLAQTNDLDATNMYNNLDEKDPNYVPFDGQRTYKYTKLLNVLTATAIQNSLVDTKSRVGCNSMEPGFIPASDLSRQVKKLLGTTGSKILLGCLYHGPINWLVQRIIKQPVRKLEEGGYSEVYALTEGKGGMYYRLDEIDPPSPLTKEKDVVDKMYKATLKILSDKGFEV